MEPNDVKHEESRQIKKYTLGVIVIIAGLLLLLVNTGFLPYEFQHILISWQMLLIAIGIVSLFSSESRTPGTILILIGVIFILPRIFDLPFNAMHLFWPLILIAIGVLILFRRIPHGPWHPGINRQSQPRDDGYIFEDNIFSGTKNRIIQQVFRGGHINCIFGGSELDLSQATLAEGINELEVNTIFGGVTITVPSDWKVQLKITSILGGFTDKRTYLKESPDPSRILIIKGSVIFGGGEIKCC
ncbi:MAG: cell wall-active antibiotics response protein [Bacteroidales bacterium]|jgi:predicted membrane protein|nr:cell wall-active antibiotics response protein [Bacteroidales bacterium]